MESTIAVQAPVVDDERDVMSVIDRRFRLLNDQRSVKAARHLVPALIMGVIPECACVRDGEVIVKTLARRNRLLRQS